MCLAGEVQEQAAVRHGGPDGGRGTRQLQRPQHGEEAAAVRQADRGVEAEVRGHHDRAGREPERGQTVLGGGVQGEGAVRRVPGVAGVDQEGEQELGRGDQGPDDAAERRWPQCARVGEGEETPGAGEGRAAAGVGGGGGSAGAAGVQDHFGASGAEQCQG